MLDLEDQKHMLDDKTRMKIVLECFRQAVDKDNPARDAIHVN